MKFQIQEAVLINELPPPNSRSPRGQFEPVFERIGSLPRGKALPITFAENKQGLAARSALRKIAKREGEFLSSTYSADRKTFFFWLEPKENVAEISPPAKRRA